MQGFDPLILARLRKERRLTQEDVSQVIGITRSTYGKKEKGKLPITIQELKALADYYKMEIREFLIDENQPKPAKPAAAVVPFTPAATPAPAEQGLCAENAPESPDLNEIIIQLNRMIIELRHQLRHKDHEISLLKKRLNTESYSPPPPHRTNQLKHG